MCVVPVKQTLTTVLCVPYSKKERKENLSEEIILFKKEMSYDRDERRRRISSSISLECKTKRCYLKQS